MISFKRLERIRRFSMEKSLVSVITPCYNGEKFVHRLLDSILKQTYRKIEFIFVNDGSTDNTEDIVLGYKNKFEKAGMYFTYIYQENKGQAAALNQGLKIFKGEYFVWPDSDDYFTNDSIEKKVNFFNDNMSYNIVRSNGVNLGERFLNKKSRMSSSKNRFNENIFEEVFLGGTYSTCGCYMIKGKSFFEFYPERQINESREDQNWQLLLPILSKYKCGFIDENLYCVLRRKGSHSRMKRSFQEQMKRIDEFEKLLFDILKHCECDYDKYIRLVKKKYTKERFSKAVYYRKKDLIEEQYEILQKNDWVSKKEQFLYFKAKNNIIIYIENIFRLFKKK